MPNWFTAQIFFVQRDGVNLHQTMKNRIMPNQITAQIYLGNLI